MADEFAIDRELGEVLQENEEQLTREIADHIAAKIRQGPRPALRDAHPKPHGIVKAVFKVEDDLEPQLAQGVFVPGQKYDAWIRFSNGNEDPTKPDAGGDARGMAIKLLDVPGDKILPAERQGREQDFIMINHPVFFIDHPARYLELERAKDTLFRLLEEKKDGFLQLLHATNVSDVETVLKGVPALSPQGLLNFIAMSSSKIASPLETRYW
jgi:hypothetical protein